MTHKETIEKIVRDARNNYTIREKKERNFVESKKYIEVMNNIVGKCLNNYDYQKQTGWTDDVQMLFNTTYDSALELTIKALGLDGEVVLNYKGNLISFTEKYEQGCLQSICPIEKHEAIERQAYIVCFDDLGNFRQTRNSQKDCVE